MAGQLRALSSRREQPTGCSRERRETLALLPPTRCVRLGHVLTELWEQTVPDLEAPFLRVPDSEPRGGSETAVFRMRLEGSE